MWVVRGDQIFHGSWVYFRSLLLSFPFFLCITFCSSSYMSSTIAWTWVEGFTLCASIPFLFCLSFLSLFFAVVCANPAVAGLHNTITYLVLRVLMAYRYRLAKFPVLGGNLSNYCFYLKEEKMNA